MKNKIFAYLQLMRFPNLFTSVADVLAGYLIVSGPHIRWPVLSALCLCTSFIYGGGCILNDIRDRNRDAGERPFRPIPSGRVSLWEAWLLVCLFFGLGLLTSFSTGRTPFITALVLILLVVCYDVLTKEMPVAGPINMAACRGANLLLGMSPALSSSGIAFLFPLITLVYVFALTTLSHFEVEGNAGGKNRPIAILLSLSVLVLALLAITRVLHSGVLIFLALLVLFVGRPFTAAMLKPAPDRVGKAVKFLVLGIPLLDAAYAAGIHGWTWGIPIALCAVPPLVISRYLYVT